MLFHAVGSFAVTEQSERRLPPLRSVLALGIYSVSSSVSNASEDVSGYLFGGVSGVTLPVASSSLGEGIELR